MILESREVTPVTLLRMKTSSSTENRNQNKTAWDLTRPQDREGKVLKSDERLTIKYPCSRLRNTGRGQLEVGRRNPGHNQQHQRRVPPRDPLPPRQVTQEM